MKLEVLTQQICQIAEQTAEFILEERKNFNQNLVEEKSTNSLVSYVDKEAERRIIEYLSPLINNAGFIAEENTQNRNGNEYNWIIDPLDGTTNFIHGVPCFAVSIGLQFENKIIAGVVYEANLKECFYAWENGGAFLNNRKITVSSSSFLKDSLLATGFPYYDYEKLDEYLELFRFLLKNTRGIRRPGSAATDMAYVASGRFDGFYEYSLQAWDVAAGSILIKEAGGIVSDFKGQNDFLFGNELICSNSLIYKELYEVINNYMNK